MDIPIEHLPALLAQLEEKGTGLRDSHHKLLSLAPQPADATEAKVIRLMTQRWREEIKELVLVEAQVQRWRTVANTAEQRRQMERFQQGLERYSAYLSACTLAAERLLEAQRPAHGPFVTRPVTHLIVLEDWVADATETALALLAPLRQTASVPPDVRERLTWVYGRLEVDGRALMKIVGRWEKEEHKAAIEARVLASRRELDKLMALAGEILRLSGSGSSD